MSFNDLEQGRLVPDEPRHQLSEDSGHEASRVESQAFKQPKMSRVFPDFPLAARGGQCAARHRLG